MKRLLLTLSLCLPAVLSCNREPDPVPLKEWTFEAPATKAALSGTGAFSWNRNDQIAVWDETSSSFVSFTTSSGSGRFSAIAPENAHFSTIAYYPADIASGVGTVSLPGAYTPEDLSGGAGIPMAAEVEDGSNVLHFKHLTAYLTLPVSNLSAIHTLTVTSPTVSLSGLFSPTAGAVQAQTGNAGISLHLQGSTENSLRVTIPVPVGEYALLFTDGGGSGKIGETDPITFERAHLYTLSGIDLAAGSQLTCVTLTCESYGPEQDTGNWE